jgi:hypothetical protein
VVEPAAAVRDLERVELDDEQARGVRHGMTFPCSSLPATAGPGPVAFVGPDGSLLAVYERRKAGYKPTVVVASQ